MTLPFTPRLSQEEILRYTESKIKTKLAVEWNALYFCHVTRSLKI